MITVPQPVVPGERLSAAKTNAIIDTLRRLRPIPGQGVALEETPFGVVVSAAQHAAHAAPASVSFRVTADRAAGKALRIAVDKGRLCTVGQQLCRELALTLQQDGSLTEQNGRWCATLTEDATLYIAPKEDTEDAYELRLGSIDGSTPVTARIADIHPSAESPVTQHILGDLYLSEGAAAEPVTAAWTVRRITLGDDSDATPQWCVYAPTWVTRSRTLSLSDGWYSLPSPSSGTPVCAVLKMTVSADDSAAVTVDSLIVTDDPDQYQDVAPIPPSGTGSSATEGTDGIAYYKVTVGTFRGPADALAFDQRHVGLIIADPPMAVEAQAAAVCIGPARIVRYPVDSEGSSGTETQPYIVHWFATVSANPDGSMTMTELTDIEPASKTLAVDHADDHVNGDL